MLPLLSHAPAFVQYAFLILAFVVGVIGGARAFVELLSAREDYLVKRHNRRQLTK